MKYAVVGIRKHAEKYWEYKPGDLDEIEISKIDVAIDLKGAFMPGLKPGRKEKVRFWLEKAFDDVTTDLFKNFLSLSRAMHVHVVHGNNNINSCYQYVVKDSDNAKLCTIKAYDKLLDLIGRQSHFLVGSRMSTILNSNPNSDPFHKRIVKARSHGMTRLEISCHHAAL